MWSEIDVRFYLAQPVFIRSISTNKEIMQNMFKVNYEDNRTMSVIFWWLYYLMCFEQISYITLQFQLLIMDIYLGSSVKYLYLQN